MNDIEIGSTVLVENYDGNEIECLVLDISGRKVSVIDDEANSFTVSINDIRLCG